MTIHKLSIIFLQCMFCLVYGLLLSPSSLAVDESAHKSAQWNEALIAANQRVVNELIVKNYQQLSMSAKGLGESVMLLCSSAMVAKDTETISQKAAKQQAQQAFIALRRNWAKAQLINFGPISFLERRERFDFWPDKHRVGERQMRQLLADTDKFPKSVSILKEKSVAVQDLNALERLLFSSKTDLSQDRKRCQLATLISQNLIDIATDVASQWSSAPVSFYRDLLAPEPGVTFFNNSQEVATVIFNNILTQLSVIKDLKLAKALPKAGKNKGNKRQLESWRTEASFLLLSDNIETVAQYYVQGFSQRLEALDETAKLINDSIVSQFTQAQKMSQSLSQESVLGFDQVLGRAEFLRMMYNLQILIKAIEIQMKNDVAPRLDLSLKFNALDGD